jgi:hypothetical protein
MLWEAGFALPGLDQDLFFVATRLFAEVIIIMKQREDTQQYVGSKEAPPPVRKPYHKPTARHEQVFETQALKCGKNGSQGQCFRSRGAS